MTSDDEPIERPAAEALRAEAEALLRTGDAPSSIADPSGGATQTDLIHELKVHQTELRLQNHQLRQAEIGLQQALSRYETLFHALPLAAVVIDERGIVHRANERAAGLFGFRSRAQFEGHSLMRLIAIKDRSRLMIELVKRQARSLPVMKGVWIANDAGGVEVDLHLQQLDTTYHADRHVLVTMVDQSDHYARQRQLDLLGKVVNDMGVRVIAFDRQGRCIYANREMQLSTGLAETELIGARRNAWMPSEKVKQEEQRDASILVTEQPFREIVRQTGDHGEERYLERAKFPFFDDDRECIGVGEIITDVTKTRSRDRQMHMVMEAYGLSRDVIVMTDAENRIVAVNQAFERVTGYREAEVQGKNPRVLGSGRHDRAFYQAMWRDILDSGWEGEIWNRRKSGEIYPGWLSISAIRDTQGRVINHVAVFTDITTRKAAEEEIQHLALYDRLTGLANRHLLADRVGQAIHAAARQKRLCAIVFFDLDHFKEINDSHGHGVGDRLLQQVSQRVRRMTRETDTLSRLGGDEFVLLLGCCIEDEVAQRLEELLREINRSYRIDDLRVDISASFGVAFYPTDGDDFDTLLRHADAAMYKAKEDGRSLVRFYSDALGIRNRRRLEVDAALRAALPGNEFHLVLQPQVAIADAQTIGCEALLRWRSATLGDVSPAEFIGNAERIGLIKPIGTWVMHTAFELAAALRNESEGFRVAVNLSARQLHGRDFLEVLDAALASSGIDPAAVELELTESLIMLEAEHVLELMEALKARGVGLAIDDFGTGYSSLSYLNWMPVDKLKIDRAFIRNIGKSAKDDQICRSIIGLADNLGIKTVAEGVETQGQLDFLRDAGCSAIQGFLIARPMPAAELRDWLSGRGLQPSPDDGLRSPA